MRTRLARHSTLPRRPGAHTILAMDGYFPSDYGPATPPPPPPPPRRRPPGPAAGYSLLVALVVGSMVGFVVYRYNAWRNAPAGVSREVSPRGSLAEDEQSTIRLFKNVSPSTVYITTLNRR